MAQPGSCPMGRRVQGTGRVAAPPSSPGSIRLPFLPSGVRVDPEEQKEGGVPNPGGRERKTPSDPIPCPFSSDR
eukprot:scaffold136_cov325-Pavlova_lutheri.AAC.13